MAQKRGQEKNIWILVIVVLALVSLGILLFNVFKGQLFFGTKYDQLTLQTNALACQTKPVLIIGPPGQPIGHVDRDFGSLGGDGFADSCDICLGGDDKQDEDGDGIPNACDNDILIKADPRTMSMEKICKDASKKPATWDKQRKACWLACYTKGECRP